MAEPGNLVDLALDALGKYIYMLYSHQKSITEAEATGNHIHHKIIEYIPATLADKVTNGLLHIFDHLIYESESCQPAAICELFIKNILHSAVTQIKPKEDVRDIPELFYTHGFNIYYCGLSILKTVHLFNNLKVVSILNKYEMCNANEITFPEHLVEFTGLACNALIDKLAKQCKCLKVLNVHGSRSVTCESIESVLQMKHLEKLNLTQTSVKYEGITKLLATYIKNFGKPCKLRYLMSSAISEEHLDMIAKKLPNLKVIFYSSYMDSITSNFQNVIGLDVSVTFSNLKLLLEKVGKQLVYLSVEIKVNNEFDNDDEIEISEMIPIGQNCTCLKSFRMEWSVDRYPVFIDTVKTPLPGFQTISNLQVLIDWPDKYGDHEGFENIASIVKFLLFNCPNVNRLVLPTDKCVFSKYDLVLCVVGMECMQNVEEVHFILCCKDCIMFDNEIETDNERDNEIVQLLIDNCPNLRYILGIPGLDENHTHNTQKVKFCADSVALGMSLF